jgi:NTE family protein
MATGEEPAESADGRLREGIALCLSGGGYRAMLFHVGSLWRLNEAGYLPRLDRISSVSGGSITAATLGDRWVPLDFDGAGVARDFNEWVVAPLRALASKTIDRGAVVRGVLLRGSVGDRVADAYDEVLFDGRTLQD